MHRGYTKRWRKRWDRGYHKDLLLWVMMDYFIDHANYKTKEFPFIWKGAVVEMVKIERGQCFFTFEGLANLLKGPNNAVSRKMIRSRVGILEKIGFLGHQSGRKYQVVTIHNYDRYNPLTEDEGRQPGRQRDIKGTLKGHQWDTTNKDKKDIIKKKKDKKERIPPYIPPGGMELSENGNKWIDAESWDCFLDHRKEIKKPLSKHAVKIALGVLKKNADDQKEIIENSILNNWTGLFELKNKKSDGGWDKLRKEFCKDETI